MGWTKSIGLASVVTLGAQFLAPLTMGCSREKGACLQTIELTSGGQTPSTYSCRNGSEADRCVSSMTEVEGGANVLKEFMPDSTCEEFGYRTDCDGTFYAGSGCDTESKRVKGDRVAGDDSSGTGTGGTGTGGTGTGGTGTGGTGTGPCNFTFTFASDGKTETYDDAKCRFAMRTWPENSSDEYLQITFEKFDAAGAGAGGNITLDDYSGSPGSFVIVRNAGVKENCAAFAMCTKTGVCNFQDEAVACLGLASGTSGTVKLTKASSSLIEGTFDIQMQRGRFKGVISATPM